MFDMQKVGENIGALRRRAGLSQQTLAERLAISPQAVSNWERGQSLPDVSKLGELSALLGVSIDRILLHDGAAEPDVSAVSAPEDASAHIPPIPVGGVFRPAEVPAEDGEAPGGTGGAFSLHELAGLAPFLPTEQMNALVSERLQSDDDPEEVAGELSDLYPFLSDECRMQVCAYLASHDCDWSDLLPFLPRADAERLVEQAYEKGGLPAIEAYAPFLRGDFLAALVRKRTGESRD